MASNVLLMLMGAFALFTLHCCPHPWTVVTFNCTQLGCKPKNRRSYRSDQSVCQITFYIPGGDDYRKGASGLRRFFSCDAPSKYRTVFSSVSFEDNWKFWTYFMCVNCFSEHVARGFSIGSLTYRDGFAGPPVINFGSRNWLLLQECWALDLMTMGIVSLVSDFDREQYDIFDRLMIRDFRPILIIAGKIGFFFRKPAIGY